MNEVLEDRTRRFVDDTGESIKTGGIDVACKRYLADLKRKN